ncbi:hypothetical protein MTO96_027234 [Rhipicephalus appendiculatus]
MDTDKHQADEDESSPEEISAHGNRLTPESVRTRTLQVSNTQAPSGTSTAARALLGASQHDRVARAPGHALGCAAASAAGVRGSEAAAAESAARPRAPPQEAADDCRNRAYRSPGARRRRRRAGLPPVFRRCRRRRLLPTAAPRRGAAGGRNMAAEENAATKVDHPAETVESLTREIEQLKARLEEERKKINDVSVTSLAGKGGAHQGSEHQAAQGSQGTPGKSTLLRLVAGQATHRQLVPGWQDDHMGRLHYEQGARCDDANNLGDGLRLCAVGEHGCLWWFGQQGDRVPAQLRGGSIREEESSGDTHQLHVLLPLPELGPTDPDGQR